MKRVVLIKAENENSDTYTSVLKSNNFDPIFLSSLEFKFKNLPELRNKLKNPQDYAGIIITSPRAIKAAKDALDSHLLDNQWKSLENFCVGKASYELLKNQLDLLTKGEDTGNAHILADFIKNELVNKDIKKPFLVPCGNLKLNILATKLPEFGFTLEEIEVYETIAHSELEQNLKKYLCDTTVDNLVFFSPSGVNYSFEIIDKLCIDISHIEVIAIGPSTEKALRNKNVCKIKIAEKPTPEHLVKIMLAN